jgi:hypothetical protein
MRRLIQGGTSFSRIFQVGEPIAYLTRDAADVINPTPSPAAAAPEPTPTPVAVARKVRKMLGGKP